MTLNFASNFIKFYKKRNGEKTSTQIREDFLSHKSWLPKFWDWHFYTSERIFENLGLWDLFLKKNLISNSSNFMANISVKYSAYLEASKFFLYKKSCKSEGGNVALFFPGEEKGSPSLLNSCQACWRNLHVKTQRRVMVGFPGFFA